MVCLSIKFTKFKLDKTQYNIIISPFRDVP